ncbi:hypothetical protein CC78DRAFT_617162 [Lojkania enalia]|uniref:Uncharacterized protein n=1 Tax=Lojkania enalia TaxID=147567 RepID=A0A9P4KCI2_9PLEO|nr:hypothetical protein CC78DRAFT_617162 [Didymosphaeria enalia]
MALCSPWAHLSAPGHRTTASAMATNTTPSIWTKMEYTPPLGQCNSKRPTMPAKYPCPRPSEGSTSSYERDYNHHASFPSENEAPMNEYRKRLREVGFTDDGTHVILPWSGILTLGETKKSGL